MAWLLPELDDGAEPELKPLELELELEPVEVEPLEPEPDEVEPEPVEPDEVEPEPVEPDEVEPEDEPSRPRCPMTPWRRKRYCAWTPAGPAPLCPPRPRWPR